MPTTPVTIENFRGLRLLPEPGEAQGAVDMLNADLARDLTQVSTRAGLTALGAAGGGVTFHKIAGVDSTSLAVYSNTGSVVQPATVAISGGAYSTAGTTTWGSASTRVTSTGLFLDSGGAAHLFVASRTGATNEALRFTLGSTASLGSPRYVALTPLDQRVALAHFSSAAGTPSGANGTVSTVFFSNPSSVATFSAADWIELDPGDGEEITGVVAWHDYLYVLKQSKLFVFYGVSEDVTGGAIFNYRRIDLPTRVRSTTAYGGENIIAGSDGVYLLLGDGVYRTQGIAAPALVSRLITPIFDGTAAAGVLFPSGSNWRIGYAENRTFLLYPANGAFRTLVFDALLDEWLLWDTTAGQAAQPTNVLAWNDVNALPTTYVGVGNTVYSFVSTATTDGGTAIASVYQAGFDGLGYPAQEKRIRGVEVVGSGSPTLDVYTDYASSDPLSRSAAVTLGVSPLTARAMHRKAYRGRLFSYRLSASSGAWDVNRLTWDLQGVRAPGLVSA